MSVVIGFRNWDLTRLELCVRSVDRSFGDLDGEVIVVDYGSDDPGPVSEVATRTGAQLVRVESADAPVWSRSRALNAGFAASRGDLLVSTDADMVFSPRAMHEIHTWWRASEPAALFLQCRDLPAGPTPEDLLRSPIDWVDLERTSTLRPRWGMGGMMAISREGFGRIRGFDERMHTYGREDIDFARRAQRAGFRTVWITDPEVRMYHVWHAPATGGAEVTPETRTAIDRNTRFADHDATWARNPQVWRHRLPDAPPLLTAAVVIGDGTAGDRYLAAHSRACLELQAVEIDRSELVSPEALLEWAASGIPSVFTLVAPAGSTIPPGEVAAVLERFDGATAAVLGTVGAGGTAGSEDGRSALSDPADHGEFLVVRSEALRVVLTGPDRTVIGDLGSVVEALESASFSVVRYPLAAGHLVPLLRVGGPGLHEVQVDSLPAAVRGLGLDATWSTASIRLGRSTHHEITVLHGVTVTDLVRLQDAGMAWSVNCAAPHRHVPPAEWPVIAARVVLDGDDSVERVLIAEVPAESAVRAVRRRLMSLRAGSGSAIRAAYRHQGVKQTVELVPVHDGGEVASGTAAEVDGRRVLMVVERNSR
ncbi:glycosyltransferase family 2 protein [Brevibacterium litoralis]|uniref:glycosyltransferase family 2 protein n=1 Tax=Brevibacterium litoralis TaxID=3138935 RepID=UPI0032ED20C0